MQLRRVAPLLLAIGCAACSGGAPGSRVNVLLICVDTLRADALGAYGGPVATPALDGLAAEGVLFEQAIAPAPETAPSHATLFTGREVQRHGLVRNGIPLAEGLPTLAESFRDAGYATAGFASSFILDARFGWGRGFDTWDASFSRDEQSVQHRTASWAQHEFAGFDRRAEATNRVALEWLAEAPEPFFAFVHYFDPHSPHVAPPQLLMQVPAEYARRAARERIEETRARYPGLHVENLQNIVRQYQAEALYTDRALGELLDALDARGVRERTLVAVTADHGEGLGQHGSLDHAPHLYEEELRVPLVLRWPGRLPGGVRLATPVGLVDVAPTLAELAGVAFPADADGRSLAPSARAGREPEARPLVGRRRHYEREYRGHRGTKRFVRSARWKYIRASDDPDELYDLANDPGERRNVHDLNPGAVARLGGVLDAHLATHPDPPAVPELPEDVRRGLEALGYAGDASGAD